MVNNKGYFSLRAFFFRITLLFILIFFCLSASWQIIWATLDSINNRHDAIHPIPESDAININDQSLIYKLLDIEKKWGVLDWEIEAKYNFNWFFEEALKIESPELTTQNVKLYFEKVSALMNKYFIYEAGTTLTEGLANQKIDCDLRSYIFYDLSKKIGLNTHVVYSPGHAFVVWKSPPNHIDVIWETTARGKGNAVSITSQNYTEAHDGITYRPVGSDEIIFKYELFTAFNSIKQDKKNINKVRDLTIKTADRFNDWLVLQEAKAYFLYDDGKNKNKNYMRDIAERLLQLQPANSMANYILMDYFFSHGENEKARDFFEKIPTEDKDFEARLIYAGTYQSWIEKMIFKIDAHFYKLILQITPFDDFDKLSNPHHIFLLLLFSIWIYQMFKVLLQPNNKIVTNSVKKTLNYG